MTGPTRGRFGRLADATLMATLAAAAAASWSAASPAGTRTHPVGRGTTASDPPADPWIAVTDAMVAPLLTPTQRAVRRRRRIAVDYDGDGRIDEAWMVANSRQMGVMVRLGGSGRTLLAYRTDGRWGDQSLFRVGGSIGVEFPESTVIVLFEANGRPRVRYLDEGER